MNIGFLGYRNSGKSTLSKFLKKATNRPIVETDNLIKDFFKMEIPEIIQRMGWETFRFVESAILGRCSKLDNSILDLGGGVILNEKAMEKLKDNSVLIYLDCSVETLIARAKSNYFRPPLTPLRIEDEIRMVLNERKPIYEKYSDYVINTNGYSEEECCEKILNILKKEGIIGDIYLNHLYEGAYLCANVY